MACPFAVLIVEDDDALRDALAEGFRRLCHSVLVARNGLDALELINSGTKPCAVLTDIEMPDMGGRELIAALADAGLGGMPVVTMSGARESLAGDGVHLRKPFELSQVIGAVAACTGDRCAIHGQRRTRGEETHVPAEMARTGPSPGTR